MSISSGLNRVFPKEILGHFLEGRRFFPSLIFLGESEVTAKEAYCFASSVVCIDHQEQQEKIKNHNHPDLIELSPDTKAGFYCVDHLRKTLQKLPLHPFESSYCVTILYDCDRMLDSSSNALLKTLEEPFKNCLFILTTQHLNRVLPTIVSRSQIIAFDTQETMKFEIQDQVVEALIHHENMVLARHLNQVYQNAIEKEKESTRLFQKQIMEMILRTILHWYRDVYYVALGKTALLRFPDHIAALQKKKPCCLKKLHLLLKETSQGFELSLKPEQLLLRLCFELF